MGLAWMPSCVQVTTSKSSSTVPKPPGSATKASARSAISALRSASVSTTSSSLSPVCASSRSWRDRGMMPTTSPPAASAASATAPISPTRAPP